eukprot:TRINITY_DN601_c1_g2_i1.p1 TRINITY_DN601_c1_g2~~TRINITY_DN601_c1_g2_i1.p1  ORF type:complete len:285 (-),score=72.19 TRINITY_DN601_c1_g2_i1:225-1079(-)
MSQWVDLSKTNKEYKLFYWPQMLGRGEFIRLLFVETDTDFEEVSEDIEWDTFKVVYTAANKPFFAMPAICHTENNEEFWLSQTSVILKYLATKLDDGRLLPEAEKDRFQAEMIMEGICDLVAEGHDTFHAIDRNASYDSQKEQVKPFVKYYQTVRLPRWIRFFGHILLVEYRKFHSNNDNDENNYYNDVRELENQVYLVNNQLSYVDLALFHVFDGNRFQFPDTYHQLTHLFEEINEESSDNDIETAKGNYLLFLTVNKIGNMDKIKQHCASRKYNFTGTGPIF